MSELVKENFGETLLVSSKLLSDRFLSLCSRE